MLDFSDRIIPIKITNPTIGISDDLNALIDTGAAISCIPIKVIHFLNLKPIGQIEVSTASGKFNQYQYFANIEIKNSIFQVEVIGIDYPDIAIIGWDILSKNKILPNLIGTIFEQTLSLLSVIPEFKKNVVLILGQDTTEIKRLHSIRKSLKNIGYDGIIVKEIADIEIQSVEEKVNMLASLSRFIICDNSVTSGHIDELKICASNRFTTAIIQEKNKGATWMQADYKIDYNFIKTFTYPDFTKIPETVIQAVDWAEQQLIQRSKLLNELYHWRQK